MAFGIREGGAACRRVAGVGWGKEDKMPQGLQFIRKSHRHHVTRLTNQRNRFGASSQWRHSGEDDAHRQN
jgi:hypothetical protein